MEHAIYLHGSVFRVAGKEDINIMGYMSRARLKWILEYKMPEVCKDEAQWHEVFKKFCDDLKKFDKHEANYVTMP